MLMILPNGELKEFNGDELYEALIVYLLGITDFEAYDENAIPTRSLADCALSTVKQVEDEFDGVDVTSASIVWQKADEIIASEVDCYCSLILTESFSEWLIGDYEIEWNEVLA